MKERSRRCETSRHLHGLSKWLTRMENKAEHSKRMDRLTNRDEKRRIFSERIHPNTLLTGWRTLWSRMEAERIREDWTRKKSINLKKGGRGAPRIIFLIGILIFLVVRSPYNWNPTTTHSGVLNNGIKNNKREKEKKKMNT